MIKEKALSIEEVKDIISSQTQNKVLYSEEVKKQLTEFDNEIYHIRNGKISYQPTLINRLMVIAKELGNEEFISRLSNLVNVESKLEMNLTLEHDKHSVECYSCTLKSELPQLSPIEKEGLTIHFSGANIKRKQDNYSMLSNIESKLKQDLNREQVISLYTTKNTNQLFDVTKQMKDKLEELGFTFLFEIKTIRISDNNKEIKLGSVTKFTDNANKTTVYQNYYTYDDNIRQQIKDVYQENLENYTETKVQPYLANNEIKALTELLNNNTNFVKKKVNFDGIILAIHLELRNLRHIVIYLDKNGSIEYYIQELDGIGYRSSALFKESYKYNYTTMEKLYEEICTIYEKAEIILGN